VETPTKSLAPTGVPTEAPSQSPNFDNNLDVTNLHNISPNIVRPNTNANVFNRNIIPTR
jgi:hypothetical protein